MNCIKVEKLLPLYVGGDLNGRDTARVRAHIYGCDYCQGLAEEFRASQERLRSFAVPEFGAQFYEEIRGAVLREINSGPAPRPSVTGPVSALFAGWPRMAASLAILTLLSLLSLGIYHSLVRSDATHLISLEEGAAKFNPVLFAEAPKVEPDTAGFITKSDDARRPAFASVNSARQKFRRDGRIKARPPVDMSGEDGTDGTLAAEPERDAQTENKTQAIARIEIQTNDPNIRIIWLARRASE